MRLPLAALLLMPLLVASVPKAAAVAPRAPELPSLDAGHWLNSPPLTLAALRGRPVLIEFWTFGCSNCRNTLPFGSSKSTRDIRQRVSPSSQCTRRSSTASATGTRSRGQWRGAASVTRC